jgi:tight adherence protein C
LFPLIFCVLPTLFIVILGPGIIRMIQSFTQL